MIRKLIDRLEQYESEIKGSCSCGEPVIKVINSSVSTRVDKIRYRYPDNYTAWNIFRCQWCEKCIEDSFIENKIDI